LDASVAINVYASTAWPEVFEACGLRPVLAWQAARESLWVRDEDGARLDLSVDELVAAELVEVWSAEGAELELLVQLAARLGDGEAASIAIAISRGLEIATDDIPAQREIERRGLGERVWTTPRLMRTWASAAQPDRATVQRALVRIRQGASYIPRRDAVEYGWWAGHDATLN
jgi:hypothetical protein